MKNQQTSTQQDDDDLLSELFDGIPLQQIFSDMRIADKTAMLAERDSLQRRYARFSKILATPKR